MSDPSPEALKMNAIVTEALKAAQEAFNQVLVARGLVAIGGEYDIEANLSFKLREKPPAPADEAGRLF